MPLVLPEGLLFTFTVPALCPASAEDPGGPLTSCPWFPYLFYTPTKPSVPQAPPRPGGSISDVAGPVNLLVDLVKSQCHFTGLQKDNLTF